MVNQRDFNLFKQIYTKVNFYMRKEQAYTIADYAAKKSISIPEAINTSLVLSSKQVNQCVKIFYEFHEILKDNAQTALNKILKIGYRKYLDSNGINTNKLDILFALSRQENSIIGLRDRLIELHNLLKNKVYDYNSKFILSTIHSSKGLEYDNVYLLDVIDGVFPSELKTSLSPVEKEKIEEEERRVFYVGITRAKNSLSVFENKYIDSTYVSDLFEKKEQFKNNFLGNVVKTPTSSTLPEKLAWMTIGAKVRHLNFGEGKITSINENYVTVKFNSGKTFPFVIKHIESSNVLKKV
jgi:DNA helicase-2/ATP-dependent DNA helicase PcrA